MNELNVLILSAGRRVELVQCFQQAAQDLQINSKVIAGDCSNTAPALYFADGFHELPRIDDPNYIQSIIKVCKTENIALIVPTIDTDLLLLAENKELIEKQTSAKVLISDYQVINICRDKINTQRFMEEHQFGIPKMYSEREIEEGNVTFPLFIKPKSGSSSINTFKINTINEFNIYKSIVKDPIIQDFMEGQEYTVDVFLDFNSQILSIVPRLRLATRSGEISKGKIVKDQDVIRDVRRLIETLKPIGHITVQLMRTQKGIEYIEINPRFGGGAPMSIKSGANSCKYLYQLLLGEQLQYDESYRENITFLRFDSSICIDDNMDVVND